MALINITPIQDGTTAQASQVNTPLQTIVDEFNGNISSVNLANGAVTTNKLGDGAVTPDKRSAGDIIKTVTSTSRTASSSSYTSLTDNIVVPAGVYEIYFAGQMNRSSGSQLNQSIGVSLSTDASTETNPELTAGWEWLIATTDNKSWGVPFTRTEIVTLETETTFTMMGRTSSGSMTVSSGAVLRARKLGAN